jgi:hypothetical protein
MNMPGLSPIEWVLIITFAVIVVAGIGTWAFVRKRRLKDCALSLVALNMPASCE